ncbi:MAG: hypothetical protein WKF61_00930 [Luteimonas sp.]
MQPVHAVIRDREGLHLRSRQGTRLDTFDALPLQPTTTTAS